MALEKRLTPMSQDASARRKGKSWVFGHAQATAGVEQTGAEPIPQHQCQAPGSWSIAGPLCKRMVVNPEAQEEEAKRNTRLFLLLLLKFDHF